MQRCQRPKLTSSAANGDFKSAAGKLINYDWDLSVPEIPSLGFAANDTYPGEPAQVTNSGGYSQKLADGVFGDLFLNLCYNVPGGSGVGGTQGDPSNPGSSGCAASPRVQAPPRLRPEPIRKPSPSRSIPLDRREMQGAALGRPLLLREKSDNTTGATMTRRVFATLMAATALTTVLMAGATAPAEAMDVSPMISKITPSGNGSSYRMTVRNDSATPATVEIETYRMQVDDNGARSLVEDDKDITVFPVQSVIPANREQVIQVRYTGDATEEGRMYLVRAAQLPINMQTTPSDGGVGADIQVAFTINTYVFVAPPRARAEVQVTAVSREPNGDVILTAHNSGTGFAYIRESKIILKTADGQSHEVPAAEVDVGQVSVIAGGATRQVKIPAALAASASGDLTASIVLL